MVTASQDHPMEQLHFSAGGGWLDGVTLKEAVTDGCELGDSDFGKLNLRELVLRCRTEYEFMYLCQ